MLFIVCQYANPSDYASSATRAARGHDGNQTAMDRFAGACGRRLIHFPVAYSFSRAVPQTAANTGMAKHPRVQLCEA